MRSLHSQHYYKASNRACLKRNSFGCLKEPLALSAGYRVEHSGHINTDRDCASHRTVAVDRAPRPKTNASKSNCILSGHFLALKDFAAKPPQASSDLVQPSLSPVIQGPSHKSPKKPKPGMNCADGSEARRGLRFGIHNHGQC
eukprot:4303848-Amphidinium_carterae.1